jgi:hypothetical protein
MIGSKEDGYFQEKVIWHTCRRGLTILLTTVHATGGATGVRVPGATSDFSLLQGSQIGCGAYSANP